MEPEGPDGTPPIAIGVRRLRGFTQMLCAKSIVSNEVIRQLGDETIQNRWLQNCRPEGTRRKNLNKGKPSITNFKFSIFTSQVVFPLPSENLKLVVSAFQRTVEETKFLGWSKAKSFHRAHIGREYPHCRPRQFMLHV